MLRHFAPLTCALLFALAAPGCGSDEGGTTNPPADTGTTDTGTTDTGTTDTGTDDTATTDTGATDTGATDTGATDTGATETGDASSFKVVNGCEEKNYIDGTTDAAKRKVPWGFGTNNTNGCIKIKKGQSVTWDPPPSPLHPLEASGGDTPNPITNKATNTFGENGTFGYKCTNHPSMTAAILVVP